MLARLRRKSLRPRGVTLLEGMIASAVFVFGLTGAMQGIIIASRQNAFADRAQRSAAIARQMSRGLEAMSARRLLEAGALFDPANCSSDAAVKKIAGDLAGAANACVIDFDAIEASRIANSKPPLVPDYPQSNKDLYRRVLVYLPMNPNTDQQVEFVDVVVGWKEMGMQKRFSTFISLHDPTRNMLTIEL